MRLHLEFSTSNILKTHRSSKGGSLALVKLLLPQLANANIRFDIFFGRFCKRQFHTWRRAKTGLATMLDVADTSLTGSCMEIEDRHFKVPSKLTYEVGLVGNYDSAVLALNSLQSNADTIRRAKLEKAVNPAVNVQDTATYLKALGIEVSDLSRLNVIHVSGTKGKGSVCAQTEALLSSPHLIHVRERIRINGKALSEEDFCEHFWTVYRGIAAKLPLSCENGRILNSMPSYFKFLTVMAFEVFMAQRVDVAIVEVGIGGQYDCTNAVQSPAVCGITSLDFDHCDMLGDTLESIAWHKAGILKPNCEAVTVMQDEVDVCRVLSHRAKERHCNLTVAPLLEQYPASAGALFGNLQLAHKRNLSLALQLADKWCRKVKGKSIAELGSGVETPAGTNRVQDSNQIPLDTNDNGYLSENTTLESAIAFPVDQGLIDAILTCNWPGRTHTIEWTKNVTLFLDGAHTPKSLQLCSDWFCERSFEKAESAHRVLVFHCTGSRAAESLLAHLPVVATATSGLNPASDQSSRAVTDPAHTQHRCWQNAKAFEKLITSMGTAQVGVEPKVDISLHQSAEECVRFVELLASADVDVPVHVLITGSLHLVGAFMSILNQDVG